jgi:ketosteroid isomerase-like protein
MLLNYDTAKAIVEETHRAWSEGDIDAVLRIYAEDIFYKRNAGDRSTPPLVIQGREAMGVYLREIQEKASGMAVVKNFQFRSGIGRARVTYFLEDRASGQTHTATYRQTVAYRGLHISRIEQFHDSARLSAFFRLIGATTLAKS